MKTLKIAILSWTLLMTSAFATTPREAFVNKMEKQTTSIFEKAQNDMAMKTDKELMETYGDYVLAVVMNNEDTVAGLGLNLEDGIRSNLERIFSEEGKDLIMKNLERYIDEAGSVEKFKKQAKTKLNGNLKDVGPIEFIFKGIASVFQTVFMIITFPIWFPMLLIMLNNMG